eukprot:scpid30038/ scgid15513/ DNA ligase 4; DNA ligase IV; Polydeoxyribonucleotide synthase [ATP] 4
MAAKRPTEVAAGIPFEAVCSLCEKICKVSGTDKKKDLVKNFFSKWRELHKSLHGSTKVDDSLYAGMRLLLPQCDRDRLPYGMKEVTLAKYYIEIIGLGKDSPDAQKLLQYKAPRSAKSNAGDFASVAFFVLQYRCEAKGSLSLADVNRYLDDIANGSTTKDKAAVKQALQQMLRKTTALQQKWLIRIILKELKLGLSETSAFKVFHPDAEELYNVCNNLKKVCEDLHDLSTRLEGTDVSLFSAFKPMLASRPQMTQVPKLMGNKPFVVETKYDGDRIQLHKDGDVYAYFSRNAKDYSANFGASSTEGSFTPHIHGCFSSGVRSCILDGEMVAYHPQRECFISKGRNVDVKNVGFAQGGGGSAAPDGAQQCFVVYDVVYLNGKSLTGIPFSERTKQLPKVFAPVAGRLQISEQKLMSTKEELTSALNDAIDQLEEGLMVKDPESIYKPDKRNGSGWFKIKPEYVDSLSDQLDLVIVGGFFGKGRRGGGGGPSHFLLAVAEPCSSGHPTVFQSFCKVGSGYSHKELFDLNMQLKSYWKDFNDARPPPWLQLQGNKMKPDVYIEPSKSKIVQVKAAEIITSDKFRTGCTLRFPRMDKIRDDKEWYECMTVDELQALKQSGSGRLVSRHIDSGDEIDDESPKKKKRAVVRVERPRTVAMHFQGINVGDVTAVSKMFAGLEFYVVNGPADFSKADVEREIAAHGGKLVQSPTDKTFCVLADRIVARVRSVISMDTYDVVQLSWLRACLDGKKLLPFLPGHMLHSSPSTASKFAEEFDQYGDNFTEDITEEQMHTAFQTIGEQRHDVAVSQDEILEIEQRYLGEASSTGLLRGLRFYVDKCAAIGQCDTLLSTSPLRLTELEIRFHGGAVSDNVDDNVSHVVCHESDLSRLAGLNEIRRGRKRKFHCVTSDWVQQCIHSKALTEERPFAPSA